MKLIDTHCLAIDPDREHRINANSFQQDAIVVHKGWQYVCFYTQKDRTDCRTSATSRLLINVSRRQVHSTRSPWETLTFHDYEQTMDDGHNTISMGISADDGVIHLSFDHHCDELRYRYSRPGLASEPSEHQWTTQSFGPVQHELMGTKHLGHLFAEVTYPRFLSVGSGMLFTYRIGKAGTGSDVLFKYSPSRREYTYLGEFLTGVNNNPYVNGISYCNGRLHVSGCYRGFIEYDGVHDSSSTAHAVQAGPNGPENNYDFFYAYSDDDGSTWRNTDGEVIKALNKHGDGILPDTKGFVVFSIPKNSGILNQEAQTCDEHGAFHALNRENGSWIHYFRNRTGSWSKNPLKGFHPTSTGSRGGVITFDKKLFIALPGNVDKSLTILGCDVYSHSLGQQELLWAGDGFDGEPNLNIIRSDGDTVLSVYTRTSGHEKNLVVLDFQI